MPLVGWSVGLGFKGIISSADRWIAFVLLGLVGGRMIYSDVCGKEVDKPEQSAPRGVATLLVLAVVTSIDALVVGFSLTFVGSILIPPVVIGLVTFSLCFAGVRLGHKYSHFGGGKVQAVGGVILVAIGIKILIEHLS